VSPAEPVVRVGHGALRGVARRHSVAFLGVPYAEDPVGARRFLAPRPPAPWDGVRDAGAFAPPMPQPLRELPGVDSGPLLGPRWTGTEPQLTLNVWTPEVGAGGLPVMVFLHGGAFVAGSPGAPMYDGEAFARDGVVLVSVAYRLGVEGFLRLEGGDANVALRDQLAALAWVQEEIAAFGGDPGNVTVFGQSAGAICLDLLLGSPLSRGLFRRAISQSGGARLAFSDAQAARVADAVAALLGVPASSEAFRGVPVAEVMRAQSELVPGSVALDAGGERDPAGGLALVLPVRDGEVVPEDPLAAIAGRGEVDLLIGDTLEEGNLYLAGTPGFDEMTDAQASALAATQHPDPERLLGAYRAARPHASAGAHAAQVLTDAIFHLPTLRVAERHADSGAPTWVYEFAWRSSGLGGRLGACHGVELPFVFDTLDAPGLRAPAGLLGPGPAPEELAARLHRAWVAFARSGDPGWARFDTARRTVMHIGSSWQEVADPRADEHRVWEGVA
jgi:para-nitrobenzyl esterase